MSMLFIFVLFYTAIKSYTRVIHTGASVKYQNTHWALVNKCTGLSSK